MKRVGLMLSPSGPMRGFGLMPRRSRSSMSSPIEPSVEIAAKDGPDLLCILLDDGELLAKALIAQGHGTADPDALALGGCDLVPHPLADHLALELGEGQQHVEGEPTHAGGGVEGLRHRDERHLMGIEALDQLGEVGERAGETIDLVDDDDLHPALSHFGQKLLQGRTIERGAGEPAIVIVLGQQAPALMGLALHIGLAGFALGIERVEGEVEVMLGRFAGVDGAAQRPGHARLHGRPSRPCDAVELARTELRAAVRGRTSTTGVASTGTSSPLPRRPKKRGPFQEVPVMARAMVERLA